MGITFFPVGKNKRCLHFLGSRQEWDFMLFLSVADWLAVKGQHIWKISAMLGSWTKPTVIIIVPKKCMHLSKIKCGWVTSVGIFRLTLSSNTFIMVWTLVLFLGWNQYFAFILMLLFFGVSLYIIISKDCLNNHDLIKQNLGTPWIQIWLSSVSNL